MENIKQKIKDAVYKAITEYKQFDKAALRIDGVIPDLKELKVGYGNPEYISKLIKEGLIHTYDVNSAGTYICNKYNLYDNQFQLVRGENGENVVCIVLSYVKASNNLIGDIKHDMKTCGYFQCNEDELIDGFVYLWFEPKFPEDITQKVHDSIRYLYHLTLAKNIEKIKRIGLVPKKGDKRFFYPERVYSVIGDEINSANKDLFKEILKSKTNNNTALSPQAFIPFVVKIDVSKIPITTKFYNDPMAEESVYTYGNIPKEAIVCITKAKLK